jgi:xanthine dehydrogenase small subunit
LGARASWTAIEEICKSSVPEFHKIVSIFGAPQIRHVGTIGGNIANASPIADSLPFLYVMEARLELQSAAGTREVNINDFYKGYKKFDLRPGELITRVRVPLPAETDLLRLYKVSRRRDLDIATFTAAIRVRTDGYTIAGAAIAFGAVGPIVIRARKTESFLRGRPFDEDTMCAAGDVAIAEITPISDVRGTADFRYQLTRNVLLKFFQESQSELSLT